jgi:hypothetical protein
VPQTAQIGVDIGARIFDNALMQTAAGTTLEACLSKCDVAKCCFVQFDYGHLNKRSASCNYLNLQPSGDPYAYKNASAALLFHKLPPSSAIAAASVGSGAAAAAGDDVAPSSIVKGKTMSSGLYARCNVAFVGVVGRALDVTFDLATAKLSDCKRKCDMMSTCFGFTVHAGVCSLRGGTDAADMRTLFNSPNPDTIVSLYW